MLTGRGRCGHRCSTTVSRSCRCLFASRNGGSWQLRSQHKWLKHVRSMHCCQELSIIIMIAWLQALGNVLVVAPAALLGLVEGSLRISHSAALKFIRLREDFKSARLPGGISLAQAFADE